MMTRTLPWVVLAFCVWSRIAVTAEYDPLAMQASSEAKTAELIVKDEPRQREIPVKLFVPAGDESAPIVLFSHGLGGTREGCAYLGKHWAARGYIVLFLQHPGSDDSVWRDAPLRKRMAAMRKAASPQNFILRVGDVRTVIDQLEKWNADEQHELSGRLDLKRVGMSGHSFGAVTTQAVSGQSYSSPGAKFTDTRIKAAVALSPSGARGGDSKRAFSQVKIPWLVMTGTKDTSPIGGQTVESRMSVYPSLPNGIDKYELVLHDAEHSAFSDRALPGDREPRNPNHHRAILAISTAFWDAYLLNNDDAAAWLRGEKVRSVLESQDGWRLQTRAP